MHSDKEKDRIMRALVDVSELTATILALNLEKARRPYFAHQKRLREFLEEVVRRHPDEPDGPTGSVVHTPK